MSRDWAVLESNDWERKYTELFRNLTDEEMAKSQREFIVALIEYHPDVVTRSLMEGIYCRVKKCNEVNDETGEHQNNERAERINQA